MRRIENWRPITLLNLDYKILSKILAQKLQSVLPDLISEHQTGFMKGRNIKENIRKTIEIAKLVNSKKLEFVIYSIDFQKCFDSCKHEALLGVLDFFGFPETYKEWVRLLFTNFKLCVQNNGMLSPWIVQQVGLHQGCCYSPLGYLLCGEVFSLLLENAGGVEGINFENLKELLSQFADDTDLFLSFRRECIIEVTKTLDIVEDQLGLKVNYDKSTMYRVGSLKKSCAQLYTPKPIKWSDLPINVLGVWVHDDTSICHDLNFKDLIPKVESVLNVWQNRRLTLFGRVLIVNSLVESLFVHKMQCLELLNDKWYDRFQALVTNYIWKGRRPKISHKIMCAPKKQGGLCLVNFKAKHKVLLISWVPYLKAKPFFQMCFEPAIQYTNA